MSLKKPPLQNNVVLASAGSGKTFRLSDRILKLLALGVKPEEIVALTFTRAAAAEFVAKTLDKLAEAAADPAKATELSQRLELGAGYDQAFFRGLLRRTLLSMQRLTLGTLDSFFARLVVNNPAEVGLDGPEVRTMDDLEGARARRGVLSEVLASTDAAELREVARELRDLNQGKEVAMPLATFESRVAELHDLLTLAPESTLWGEAKRIWGETPRLLTAPSSKALAAAAQELTAWAEAGTFHATLRKGLLEFTLAVSQAKSAGEIDDKYLKTMAGPLVDVTQGVDGREVTINYSRQDITFPSAICAAYRTLAAHALALGVKAKLEQTQAIRRLLGRYETVYAQRVRRRGRLTFSDYVTLLLNADESVKLGMDYRLDCRVRHWLFDEFQDTSTRQWKVLANNLSEVLESSGDEWRTAFFVGDLKQSLYGWRAGNPRLLADIRDRMVRLQGTAKAEERLIATRRCSQPVVDMVNTLLGNLLPQAVFVSEPAIEKWAATFETHRTLAKRPEDGEALWVRLPEVEETEGEDVAESSVSRQARWIGEHLKSSGVLEGRRLRAGITCAILVSKNDQAAEITETLRRMGIEAADEGETSVTQDNPLTAGLVALVRAAAHPGDSRAQGLAEMSSASRTTLARLGGWNHARERLAEMLQAQGAEGLVQELLKDVDLAGDDNAHAFLRKRVRQLIALAVAYDQTGERSLEGLCGHLEGSSLRDTADPQSVQVLTIHRSKGLQYTCVYLPCLNNTRQPLAGVRLDMPMVKEAEDFSPEWILSRPKSAICELDETLRAQTVREAADVAYENLCRIYVGMTRAVRRLVLITDALKPDKLAALRDEEMHGKYDVAKLLEGTLGQGSEPKPLGGAELVWSTGSAGWIANEQTQPMPAEAPAPSAVTFEAVVRPERLKPSAAGKHGAGRSWAPSQQVAAGKAFGSLVHDLMEPLGWDIAGFETALKEKTATTNDKVLLAARDEILKCLAAPTVREALGKRPEGALLWTERQASLMYEGKLMHAVFDRVHVVPGKEAVIIDYKTNDGLTDTELADIYRGQMELYRIAVAKLASVPVEKVRCLLIHVRKGTVVEVGVDFR